MFTSNQPLTADQIRRVAPAVFAEGAHESRSDRYLYVPTFRIIEAMGKEGFFVAAAGQSGSRSGDKEHTKHIVRFRHHDQLQTTAELGQLFPEVILVNSHNGSCSYVLGAGLFRLVCLNGMTTKESYGQMRVRHTVGAQEQIIEGSFEVIRGARLAADKAAEMRGIELKRDEQMLMAQAVHGLRFGDSAQAEAITPDQLLQVRRPADRDASLWTTFNRLQENAVRGGLRGVGRDSNGRRRNVRTREIKGIDQSQGLNRALWVLAEGMAHLKQGGSVETMPK